MYSDDEEGVAGVDCSENAREYSCKSLDVGTNDWLVPEKVASVVWQIARARLRECESLRDESSVCQRVKRKIRSSWLGW